MRKLTTLLNSLLIVATTSLSQVLHADNNYIEPIMVTLPAGEFLMGSNESTTEQPIHTVKISAFKLAKYDVTVKEFLQFTNATDYKPTGSCLFKADKGILQEMPTRWGSLSALQGDFIPINCVSWKDTQAYVDWLSTQTGKHYRLPSEAEWEYAARAGSAQKFHFGNDEKQLCQYGNGNDKTTSQEIGRDLKWPDKPVACDDHENFLSTVGLYLPNRFGLYDMVGNVSQWVADCYHDNYEGAPTDGSAWISEKCSMRSRKGSTYGPGEGSHAAMRAHGGQNNRSSLGEGFRIVEDIQKNDICSDASSACKKVSGEQNAFETELAEAQKAELIKRKQAL